MLLRLFLGTVPDDYPKSTLHTWLDQDSCLQLFKNLITKERDWQDGTVRPSSEGEGSDLEDLSQTFGVPPSKRKRAGGYLGGASLGGASLGGASLGGASLGGASP
jgi:hypothetical protein